MRKLFNKPWFVGLLAVAALIFVARSFLIERASTFVAPSAEDEVSTSVASSEPESTRLSIHEALKELSVASPLRDPFLSRATTTAASTPLEKAPEPDTIDSFTVAAVWIQEKTTYILINQQIYHPGDHVGRLTLESANREGVWVRHWKGRDFISVGKAFTLTTPASQLAAALSISTDS